MDASTIDQADLDRLTDKDKQDLRQFIQNEQQRTRIQARMRPNPPPPRQQSLLSLPRANQTVSADRIPRPDRDVLQEVRHRLVQERSAGQGRAGVPDELCGPVYGR